MRAIRVPTIAERTLDNGLYVVAARRSGVPRLEARLFVGTVRDGGVEPSARQAVLAETLLSGTPHRSSVAIAETLQSLGAALDAGADVEWLTVRGSSLSTTAASFLALMGEVVTEASFPSDEVALERLRLAETIQLARSQPEVVANDALAARLYGRHPYGRGTPDPAAVARVSASSLRVAHGARILPRGSVLVLVGDLAPARAVELATSALGRWAGGKPRRASDSLESPPTPSTGATVLVHRDGSVQTNIRIGGAAVPRSHPDFGPLVLANLVFGGYFTSRLVDNIRERRGYTYSPHSTIAHHQRASLFAVSADVGTEVTAAALLEIRYELGRMVAAPVDQAELDAARRYALGSLAMSVQTQAGLAQFLANAYLHGQDVNWLHDYPRALARVTVEDVHRVAGEYFAPRRMATVLVGDSARVVPQVQGFDELVLR
jgi:predicted Zn-dependent peptidase